MGTPLQYSCLENPMDRGAWWTAVHGVARSRTRLSEFTFTFQFHASNLDWWSISHMVIFMFQCYSLKSSHHCLLPQSPKVCFYICLFRFLAYRVIVIICLNSMLLCCFSRVWLCATPSTEAHQAPPALEFSRQEHWSGLPFPSPVHQSEKWKWIRSIVSDSWQPHGLQSTRLLCPLDFPGKSTGVGCQCGTTLC